MTDATVQDATFDLRMDVRLDELMAEGSKRALKDKQPISRESLVEWLLAELAEWLKRPEQSQGPDTVTLSRLQMGRVQDWSARTSLAHQRLVAQLATSTPAPSPPPKETETLSHLGKTLRETQADVADVHKALEAMRSHLHALIEGTAIAEIVELKRSFAQLREGQPDFRAEFRQLHGSAAGIAHELTEQRKMIVELFAAVETGGCRFDPSVGARLVAEPEARKEPPHSSKKNNDRR